MKFQLTTDKGERKRTPIFSGVLKYFPLALAAMARVSWAGNEQHNKGEPLHWARGKSDDHMDAAVRHQLEYGMGNVYDEDGEAHLAKAMWRIGAQLQLDEERRLTEEANEKRTDLSPAASVGRMRLAEIIADGHRMDRSALHRFDHESDLG